MRSTGNLGCGAGIGLSVGLAALLGGGLLAPAPLQFVQRVVQDTSVAPQVQVGEVDGAFSAELRQSDGRLAWSIRGDALRRDAEGRPVLIEPRAEFVTEAGEVVSLRARRADLDLPLPGTPTAAQGRIRLHLAGRVVAEVSSVGLTLNAESLDVDVVRDSSLRRAAGGFEIASQTPLSINVVRPDASAYTLRGGSARLTPGPLRLVVEGPVDLEGSPLPATFGPLAGGHATGHCARVEWVQEPGEASQLIVTGVALVSSTATARAELSGARLAVDLVGAALPARDDPAPSSTPSPAWRRAQLDGDARLSWQTAGPTPQAHTLTGDRLELHASPAALVAVGAPARWTDGEVWITSPRLEADQATPAQFRLSLASPAKAKAALLTQGAWLVSSGQARATFSGRLTTPPRTREDALSRLVELELQAGEEGPLTAQREASPDRASARTLRLRRHEPGVHDLLLADLDVVGIALPGGRGTRGTLRTAELRARLRSQELLETRPSWRAALVELVLPAPFVASRTEARPERARQLSGDRLRYSEASQTFAVTGSPAAAAFGPTTLQAKQLRYDYPAERLTGEGQLELIHTDPERSTRLRAARGTAVIRSEPRLWQADRSLHPRPLLPLALESFTLWGNESRVELDGPQQLRLNAGVVRYRRSPGLLTAEGDAAGPVELSLGDRRLTAGRLQLRRSTLWGAAPTPWWVVATGGVTARAHSPGPQPTELALQAGWLALEVFGLRDTLSRPASGEEANTTRAGRFCAGDGVELGLAGADQDGFLTAERVEGDAAQQLTDGQKAIAVEFPVPWSGSLRLPRRGVSHIQAGRAEALLDEAALRTGRQEGETEAGFVRRVLRRFRARGGLGLSADGLRVDAAEADLDRASDAFLLRGDPVSVSRDGLRQQTGTFRLRLENE